MNTIETVTGPTRPLPEWTVFRRGLVDRLPGWELGFEALAVDHPRMVERLLSELRAFRGLGGARVVDLGGPWLGRDIPLLQGLSGATGVEIVASTGFLSTDEIRPWWQSMAGRKYEDFARFTTDELMLGMVDGNQTRSSVRPGLIVQGTSDSSQSEHDQAVSRALGYASRLTGASLYVTCHTSTHQVLETLEAQRVPSTSVILGWRDHPRHHDLVDDLELARRGYYLSFDHLGGRESIPGSEVAQTILQLAEHGYAGQVILASTDSGDQQEDGSRAEWAEAHRVVRDSAAAWGLPDDLYLSITSINPSRALERPA